MVVPVFAAQFLARSLYIPDSYLVSLVLASAYAFQFSVALYALRRLQFEPHIYRLRNTVILIWVALLATIVAPIISTTSQTILGTLTVEPALNMARSWGAGIFSALVFTPFIVAWLAQPKISYSRRTWIEVFCAFLLLNINNIFLFWTTFPQYTGIAAIFFLPAALLWFALRLDMRMLTLAIVWTSITGVAGTLLFNPSGQPVNVQLLSVEIYIGLLAGIFLAFTAVVEERRAAYRNLEEAYAYTSAADRAKNEFIAILAHELRNPLAPIVSSLELLKLEPQTDGAKETISNIQEHTTMIRRLLDDLLDTARLSQKKFKLQKQIVSVRDLVEQSIQSVQQLMKSRNHTLTTTLPERDMRIDADPVRIKQIIINLLDNSAKYTPPGGTIALSCVRENGQLEIRIKDSGMGIDADKLDEIFEAFRQLESADRMATGLGIGLFLTKQLAEMHDGTIEVRSEGTGRGSEFIVRLPIPESITVRPEALQAAEEPRSAASRVLIVDDNQAAAVAMKKLIAHYGHSVDVAFSGAAALQSIGLFKPEVVLLDIGMPDMDGYQVAEKLRSLQWNGLLIALTGFGQDADRAKAQSAGFDKHLIKPVQISDVLAILRAHNARS